ncbi:RNI-like protein [Durotheca rogersii]|uniref:RNI-like protein n=1 Tax=Durotheca rogersii TaxID=419775 RepID=UPI00221ED7AF|nr:RNI-like protein [Durotheca rogersii]KAI5864992.1 RNI-like protein [Durotheca rogersii]
MAAPDKVFSLEGRLLKLDTAQDLEAHIGPLRAMDDVEEIRILGNTLGVEACKLLGEVLATKKSLKVANLADIFTGRLLNEIPEALSSLLTSILNLPNLRTINLNDNAFGLNTQAPLVAFLSSHIPLQHLYLNNNGLGPHAGVLIADALSELHAKKEEARKAGQEVPYLETVICGRNRLENGSMLAWAKAFSLHNRVKEVKLVQNGIRQEGIEQLLTLGLNHATELKVIDLQDNTFTAQGAKALAKVVSLWGDIQDLGVGDSLLSARGGIYLAKALSQGRNRRLEILRLQYNDITSAGVKGLAAAVRDGLPALRRIELNGNRFSEDDESILALQNLLRERKKGRGGGGDAAGDEDSWGVDSLSDLEDVDSEEEEAEEEEEEEDEEGVTPAERAEKLVREAEEAQEEPTAQRKDAEVDELAKKLEKTGI